MFRDNIPPVLQYHTVHEDSGEGFWAAMLLMAIRYDLASKTPQDAKNEWCQLWPNTSLSTT